MTSPETLATQVAWNPGSADARHADRVLLAGDESSLETIQVILASLPRSARGQVFVEVHSESDIQPLDAPGRFGISWLVRERGQRLDRSVDAWLSEMLPVSVFGCSSVYAWIASRGPAVLLTSD